MEKTTTLLVVLAILWLAACDPIKYEPPCYRTYEFELPVSIYPGNDTIHIGDTIWLTISFPMTLLDQATQELGASRERKLANYNRIT